MGFYSAESLPPTHLKGAPPPSDEGGKRKGKQAAKHKRNGWKILLLIGIGEFEKPPSPPLQWPFGEIYSIVAGGG